MRCMLCLGIQQGPKSGDVASQSIYSCGYYCRASFSPEYPSLELHSRIDCHSFHRYEV